MTTIADDHGSGNTPTGRAPTGADYGGGDHGGDLGDHGGGDHGGDRDTHGVPADGGAGGGDTVVEIYWRPGCVFCTRLYRGLERYRLPIREFNIWEDAAAAGRVRAATGGDEVVPTVFVGSRALVGPTPDAVLGTLRLVDPRLHATALDNARGPLARLFGRRKKQLPAGAGD